MKKYIFMVCFIFLFLGSAKAQDIKEASVEVLAKTSSSWDGKELPNYPKGKPEITILRIKIPPRTKLPVHEHPVINAGVLLSGELTVYTEDNKKVHLQAGDSIVEVVDTWHYGKNEGNTTAEIIVFYSGVHGRPITIKK